MATKHLIRSQHDLMNLFGNLKQQQLPITVTVRDGIDRSISQNSLSQKWYTEAARWLGDREPWEVRAHCKLNYGVRMLVTEDEEFRAKWHGMILNRFTYEEKLALMVEPFDFPVTRLMIVKQMTRYLDTVYNHYAEQGVPLSLPDDRKYTQEFGERIK